MMITQRNCRLKDEVLSRQPVRVGKRIIQKWRALSGGVIRGKRFFECSLIAIEHEGKKKQKKFELLKLQDS